MKTEVKLAILIIGVLFVSVVVLLFFRMEEVTPAPESQAVSVLQPQKTKTAVTPGNTNKTPASVVKQQSRTPPKTGAFRSVRRNQATPHVTPKDRPVVAPETALKQWEACLARYTDEGAAARAKVSPVTPEEQQEMYERFTALAPEAKLENINHAVNLLPDETFPVVLDILFDKGQPPDVIITLFHDLLNRDDALKNPVMEEIAKDKSHPMYVESARILDIVK